MNAELLAATLKSRVELHLSGTRVRPAYIVGPPGVGKTQLLTQVAQGLGIGARDLHAPTQLTEDFGMPQFLSDGEVGFATPGHKFPFVDSDLFPDTGLIIVDELAQCMPDQQKIWANLFQERELHGRKLKPGWMFVATGNRITDRAGAGRILSHLNDRFTTYEFDPSLPAWCNWAIHRVRPEVISFLRFRPDLFCAFDPDLPKSPTPRAWSEGVSPTFDTVPPAALYETLKGDVGEGAAAEFTAFLQTFRALPDPDLIIASPDTYAVPHELHVLYALSGALAHRATAENFAAILTYACRKEMPPEFMILIVRDATRRNPQLENTSAYIKWSIGPGAALLLNS